MKRLFLLLAVVVAATTSCERSTEVNTPSDITTVKNLIALINEQNGEFDDAEFVGAITSSGLDQIFFRNYNNGIPDAIDMSVEVDPNDLCLTRFVFAANNTCHHYKRERPNSSTDRDLALSDGFLYMASEPLEWAYTAEDNTLTTVDQYGNTSSAIILYFDGNTVCYKGSIGREMQSLKYNKDTKSGKSYHDTAIGVLQLGDDVGCWICKEPLSMESLLANWVDEDDTYAMLIEQATAAPSDIDDQTFLDKLCSSAINLKPNYAIIDEGCSYHRTYVYGAKDDFVFHSLPHTILNHLMVFMPDNKARCCARLEDYSMHWPNDEQLAIEGVNPEDKVYANFEWRYDADTNTIYSYDDRAQAEVLYFDGDMAVLRGHLFGGFGTAYATGGDYDYFIFDFNREDRAAVMQEYAIDISEYIN